MTPYTEGECLVIVRGTATQDDVQHDAVDNYHWLMPGTLVRVVTVLRDSDKNGDLEENPEWGSYYVVQPVDNTPACWVNGDDQHSQFVYDIHVAPAPAPDVTDLASIEAFLQETP